MPAVSEVQPISGIERPDEFGGELDAGQRELYELAWGDLVDLCRDENGVVHINRLYSTEAGVPDAVTQRRLALIAVWPEGRVEDPYGVAPQPEPTNHHFNRREIAYPSYDHVQSLLQNMPFAREFFPKALVWALKGMDTARGDDAWTSFTGPHSSRNYSVNAILEIATQPGYFSQETDQVQIGEELASVLPLTLESIQHHGQLFYAGELEPSGFVGSAQLLPAHITHAVRSRMLEVIAEDLPDADHSVSMRTMVDIQLTLHRILYRQASDEMSESTRVFVWNLFDVLVQNDFPAQWDLSDQTKTLMDVVGAANAALLLGIARGARRHLQHEDGRPIDFSAAAAIVERLPEGHRLREQIPRIVERRKEWITKKDAELREDMDRFTQQRAQDILARAAALATLRAFAEPGEAER